MGRPGKYETHVKPRFGEIKRWKESGIVEKEIAKRLGINVDTLIQYKRAFPEFSELMKTIPVSAIEDVRASLLRIAKGYTEIAEESVTVVEDGGGKVVSVTKRKTQKTYPPNTRAMSLWLTNNDPSYRVAPSGDQLNLSEIDF